MNDNMVLGITLKADGSGLRGELKVSKEQLDAWKKAAEDAGQGASVVERNTNRARQSLQNLSRTNQQTARSFVNLRNAIIGLGLVQLVRSTVSAATEMQAIRSGLTVAAGSAEGAAEEFAFLREEADRLGLNLRRSASAYASLTAASRGTTLQGRASRDIFVAVSEAMTALGRDATATEGALRAIEQMISKGNVQAEELRGQLGERLPGAFQIAARAMGVTTAELNDMLDRGEVLAEDLLPKLAAELRSTFGAQAAQLATGARAEINRLQTAIFELQASAADSGFLSGLTEGVRSLSEALTRSEVREAAAELGRLVGEGLRLAGEAAKLLADNLDLVKAALAAFVAGKVVALFVGIAGSIMAAARAGQLLNAVLLGNPIVRIAQLFIAAAVLVYENWDDIRQFFIDLWVDIRALFKAGSEYIAKQFSGAVVAVKALIQEVRADLVEAVLDKDGLLHQALSIIPGMGTYLDALDQSGIGAAGLAGMRSEAARLRQQASGLILTSFDGLFEHYRNLYGSLGATGTHPNAGAPGFTPTTQVDPEDVDIPGGGAGSGSGSGTTVAELQEQLRLRLEQLQVESRMAELTEGQRAALLLRLDVEEELRQSGLSLTEAQHGQIEGLITSIGQEIDTKEEAKRLDQERESLLDDLTTAQDIYNQRIADLDALLDAGRLTYEQYAEAGKRAFEELEDASREWVDGARRALREWADDATDAAQHAEDAITGSLDKARDAFARFVSTGKLEWSSLLDYLVEEAAKRSFDELFGGLIAPFAQDILGGLFGGLSSSSSVSASAPISFGSIYHTGGIAGYGAAPSRRLPSSTWAGAPRFHGGGLADDEVAVIARRGEGIFTPRQMENADRLISAALSTGRGGVEIYDQREAGAPDLQTESTRAPDGSAVERIIIPPFRQALNRGDLDRDFDRRFNLQRAPQD